MLSIPKVYSFPQSYVGIRTIQQCLNFKVTNNLSTPQNTTVSTNLHSIFTISPLSPSVYIVNSSILSLYHHNALTVWSITLPSTCACIHHHILIRSLLLALSLTMLKWVQSGLSVVAGTAEPEYGPEAIHTVTDSITNGIAVSRDTVIEDFAWIQPSSTNVETQTFYFTDLASGYAGFAQVIHSNVMGIKTTAQFTFRLFNNNTGATDPNATWTSTALEDFRIEGSNFYAKDLSIISSGDNNETYTLTSKVNPESEVELVVTRLTPGVIFGKDGTTLYGDDIENPWGSMRHVFWPRCSSKGTIKLKNSTVTIDGYTMFVMAMQGMKPHHAAKSWNFLNFQSENFSAVQMEFTTPRSYATTKVNVAILASKDKIIATSINNNVEHLNSEVDEVGWPVPKAITFNFTSGTDDAVVAKVGGELPQLVERVDVMAEIPQFVKNIVSGVAGAKPYIYQFCNTLTIEYNGVSEEGIAFNEATFISE